VKSVAKKKVKKIAPKRDKTTGRFLKSQKSEIGSQKLELKLSGAGKEQFRELTEEIVKLAAADAEIDTHLSDLFKKYPRIKAAWTDAITERVEAVLKSKFAGPIQTQKDYRNITFNQLVEITGKTRRCIYDWLRKGLPRNADKTFNLSAFIHWFEKYTIEKLPAQVVASINPLAKMKADRLEIDLARQRNQLLERTEVMAGMLARHQNLLNSFSHKAEDLALLCNGQPQAKITEILSSFFNEVLKRQCQVPEALCLPPNAAQQFSELLSGLVVSE